MLLLLNVKRCWLSEDLRSYLDGEVALRGLKPVR